MGGTVAELERQIVGKLLNIPPITLGNLPTVIFEGERDGGSNSYHDHDRASGAGAALKDEPPTMRD